MAHAKGSRGVLLVCCPSRLTCPRVGKHLLVEEALLSTLSLETATPPFPPSVVLIAWDNKKKHKTRLTNLTGLTDCLGKM